MPDKQDADLRLVRSPVVERVLVCVLASTRAHQLTFSTFKRQVLDELNADLAVALAINENYDYANGFWQHAKYRWTAPDFSDYGDAFDLAQRWLCQSHNVAAPDWRIMLQVKGIWQGGIRALEPQRTASSILPFCRWLLLNGLEQDQFLDRYDRFVITRSDFVWLCPHPPLSILDQDAIWVPDGQNWWGLADRHLVVSRANVVDCLNVLEDILLHPKQLYEEMKHHSDWNNEQFLAHHFKRKGLLHKVRRFPYVMYTARSKYDFSPTHSPGRYEPVVGHYVKYPGEFRVARAYATIIRSRADWENGAWRQFNPSSVAERPISLARRLRYSCEFTYYTILSALTRSGRSSRLLRFLKRALTFDRAAGGGIDLQSIDPE